MQRIDTFLVAHDLVESREQAKRLILAGAVSVNGSTHIKPGQRIPPDAKVVVQAQQRYVSRGGLKLEKALRTFNVDVEDQVALDVGASTGGFTDCLLQHGAKFVYALDVGYGQLAWKLRTHPRVQPIEKTNVRHLTPEHLKRAAGGREAEFASIAVIDVSFISLRTVLPSVIKLFTQQEGCSETHYDIIALLKPQFEAGKTHVKKGGIVPDKQVHTQTIDTLRLFAAEKLGATLQGLTYSPIQKAIGNIEYLLWFTRDTDAQAIHQPEQTIQAIVAAAHESFEG